MENNNEITQINKTIKELKQRRKTLTTNTPEEKIDGKKLRTGLLTLGNPVLWLKDITSILNIRKLIIYAIILGSIYGYGYFKGIGNKPVHFDMRGKSATIALNEHYLQIENDGTAKVVDKDGNVLKTIKTRDIPGLQKALKPIGIDIHPFFTAGGSIGTRVNNGESRNSGGFEAGIGTSLFKFYKIHLNTFLTNRGIYLGPDYKLTDNFGILGGVGKGYEGSTRMFIGGKFDF